MENTSLAFFYSQVTGNVSFARLAQMNKTGYDCVLAEMFFSMGPAGMASSVTSVRSGSEMSETSMDSSTHSLSFAQPASLTAQVRRTWSRIS